MSDRSDMQLLRAYAELGDEAAFRRIVERYADLVYSAALRQVASADLAEDVGQAVFADLARKARSVANRMPPQASLAGWLYRSARFASLNQRRNDRRRIARERLVMEQPSPSPDSAPDWERIHRVLDEAMATLSVEDRDAVLLRFFQKRDLRAVGDALGVNADAAQKRVSRALERLRVFFSRQGVTVTASGLAAALTAHAVQAAPLGFAAAAALAGTSLAPAVSTAFASLLPMTVTHKFLLAAALVASTGVGLYETHQATAWRVRAAALEAASGPLTDELQRAKENQRTTLGQLTVLRAEHDLLSRESAELPKLRAAAAGRRRQAAFASAPPGRPDDPTSGAAATWARRVVELKNALARWPGKDTPEMRLLGDRDWLEVASHTETESEEARRQALSQLRSQAKQKWADAVQAALARYIQANPDQLPNDPAQLAPHLSSSQGSLLAAYEMAPPGSVQPPGQPRGSWALVEKGNFGTDGQPIRDGSNLSDPAYDQYFVIYHGGCYRYSPNRSTP